MIHTEHFVLQGKVAELIIGETHRTVVCEKKRLFCDKNKTKTELYYDDV